MRDIVERLRQYVNNIRAGKDDPPEGYLCWQAADEIERLRHPKIIVGSRKLWEVMGKIVSEAESHKPVAWMVREPDGSLHWSEMCVFEDEGSARDCAEELTDGHESNVFIVVPLYTHPPQADTDGSLRTSEN